jgi:predicted phage terminase large subunit-like protein
MQRLHEDDLCGYLLKNKSDQWQLLKIPAINPLSGAALHPEREDIDSLNRLKSELGEYNFSAQYQQEPVPINGSMMKKTWLKYYNVGNELEFSQIIQSWDTAIKAKDEHDYSVGVTIGVSGLNYYILDIVRTKVEFPELVDLVKNAACKWRPNAILVEDKASGQSLIQSLKNDYIIIAIKPKYDKITRFAAHTPLFETGRIFIDYNGSWRIALEQELLSFPKTCNDDQVDAISQALTYLQKKNVIKVRSI